MGRSDVKKKKKKQGAKGIVTNRALYYKPYRVPTLIPCDKHH